MLGTAGLICLAAAAHPELYLGRSLPTKPADATAQAGSDGAAGSAAATTPPPVPALPPDELDLDMRGRVEVFNGSVFVELGEIKTSADYATAVPQLGLRLGTLRYAVEVLLPGKAVDLTGRLFLKHSVGVRGPDQQQQKAAREEYNFRLLVHVL